AVVGAARRLGYGFGRHFAEVRMLIEAARSLFLLVDVQENLGPVMAEPRPAYRNCALLLRAAARLDIPVIISEQDPKGLGHTMGELLELAPEGAVMEKMHFSCAADPAIAERVRA